MSEINFDYYYLNTAINIIGGIALVILLSLLARRDCQGVKRINRARRITSIMLMLIGSIIISGGVGVLCSNKATTINFELEDRMKGLGLAGLSEKERDAFIKKNIFYGILDNNATFRTADRLYRNGLFIDAFGKEMFYSLTYNKRDSLYRDYYIQEKTHQVFHKDSNYHLIEKMTIYDKYVLLTSGCLNEAEKAERDKAILTTKTYQQGTRSLMLTGFTLLAWGFYAMFYRKSNIPLWKKIMKVLAYIILTLTYFNISDYHYEYVEERSIMAYLLLSIHIIAIVFLLMISNSGKKKELKEDNVHKTSSLLFSKTTLLKLAGSIVITMILFFVATLASFPKNEAFVLFYIPYFVSLEIYYMYIIWKRNNIKGEDILLLPFLKKLGIYNKISDEYVLKKKLLQSILPILLISIVSPIVNTIILEFSAIWVLSFPIIAWIVFFIYTYSLDWLDSSNNKPIN